MSFYLYGGGGGGGGSALTSIADSGSDAEVQDGNLLWATDGGGNIGAAADTRPDYVYFREGVISAHARASGTSVENAFSAKNTTAAAAGAPQYSPAIELGGQGYDTSPGAALTRDWRMLVVTTSDGAGSGHLFFEHDNDGAGYGTVLALQSNGFVNLKGTRSLIWDTEAVGNNIGIAANNRPTDGYFARSVFCGGDHGSGLSGQTAFTNGTGTIGSTAALMGNHPTETSQTNAGWIKIWVGTTAGYVPYWTA